MGKRKRAMRVFLPKTAEGGDWRDWSPGALNAWWNAQVAGRKQTRYGYQKKAP